MKKTVADPKDTRQADSQLEELNEADITPGEIELLDAAETNNGDGDNAALTAQLDNKDEDGAPLNEKSFADDITGEDLDVPGAEEDDLDEELGEEDEENNNFSEADTE